MKELGPISADAMVLAFLQAEFEARRFDPDLVAFARTVGLDVHRLVRGANLQDGPQNASRRALLGIFRSHGEAKVLYQGFPTDMSWRRVSVTPAELGQFKYANWPDCHILTNGTRRVADGVKNYRNVLLPARPDIHVPTLTAKVKAGEPIAPIIAVDGDDGVVLVEGHMRAIACVQLGAPEAVNMILGTSPNIRQWALY